MDAKTESIKVLLVNGSPNERGCTYTALKAVAGELEKDGIETEIIHIGKNTISGCRDCGACFKTGECIIDDIVNEFRKKAVNADGFVFGSPVHFASAAGALTTFMDRAFYGRTKAFYGKPAAAVVSCRRGGSTAALDRLHKYFSISSMPIVSSQYWNMVHGNTPEEVMLDLEGIQTMRVLGKNMAWLLKCIEAGRKAGIEKPEKEKKIATNFIR